MGTCFATSGDNGDVKVWQRNINQAAPSLQGLKSGSLSALKATSGVPISFSLVGAEDGEVKMGHHFKQLLHFKAK